MVGKTETNLMKIAQHLDQMGIVYERTSFLLKDAEIPVLIAPYHVKGHDFELVVMADNEWVHIKTRVFKFSEDLKFNSDLKAALYHLCLLGNFYLNEVVLC